MSNPNIEALSLLGLGNMLSEMAHHLHNSRLQCNQPKVNHVAAVKDIADRILGMAKGADDIVLELIDQANSNNRVNARLNLGGGQLGVKVEGYGDHSTDEGYGTPILIEFYQGHLRAVLWSDINQEDPTHTIDMEGAKESARQKWVRVQCSESSTGYIVGELLEQKDSKCFVRFLIGGKVIDEAFPANKVTPHE